MGTPNRSWPSDQSALLRPPRRPTAAVGEDKERLACAYLEGRGLRLVARNYRCRRGEIDLVMGDGDMLVFVEVRFRASTRFGTPAETIGIRKQRRLAAAAAHYLLRHPTNAACRFDVLAITGKNEMDWIQNAFDVD
jgi:putative endonuclease